MLVGMILAFNTYRWAFFMPRLLGWACACVRGLLEHHLILQVVVRLKSDIDGRSKMGMASDLFQSLTSATAGFVACIDLGRVGTVIWTVALLPFPGVTIWVTRSGCPMFGDM